MTRRGEQLESLSPSSFTEKIAERSYVINRVNEVVSDAISEGKLDQWEYPQIEHALGAFASALHGVPVTPPAHSFSRN